VPLARRVSGLVLIALGALSVIEGFRLRDDWQGAKLMPLAVGGVLLLLGAAHFRARPEDDSTWPDYHAGRRVAFMFAVLALYVIVLPSLGFLPATAIFVLILLRALGSYSWVATAAITAAVSLSTHVVFKHWLGMALPVGRFGV
jgi:hypothetical protein